MNTEQYLLHRFGPLMTLPDLASLLGRSTDGMRVSLYTDSEVSRSLRSTMVKIGRRVYFRTIQVNTVLHLDAPAAGQ